MEFFTNYGHYVSPFIHSKTKEKYENDYDEQFTFGDFLRMIIQISIMAYAAYLSWQCNTKMGKSQLTKIIFAAIAALFGIFYILMYFIFSSELCDRLPVKSK